MAAPKPLLELVDPEWAKALAPVEGQLIDLDAFLSKEENNGGFLPDRENILRAFSYPMGAVRVLVVGQDPYPTPGHSVGLSFAVERSVRPLPRSLQNIYRELRDDVGVSTPNHGDLTGWAESGVMLLNRVLTVRSGEAGSHRKKGWELVTECAIRALVARGGPLVAILWGKDAESLQPILKGVPTVVSAHPSPLSASRGFFGSAPFSRANELLVRQGGAPVEWKLGDG